MAFTGARRTDDLVSPIPLGGGYFLVCYDITNTGGSTGGTISNVPAGEVIGAFFDFDNSGFTGGVTSRTAQSNGCTNVVIATTANATGRVWFICRRGT